MRYSRGVTVDLGWLVGVFAALVIGAAIVNSLAPAHRRRLRRAVSLFALAALAYGIGVALAKADNPQWAEHLEIASELLRVFVLINLGALILFLVLLPRGGLVLPVIAGELIAGVGYVVATLLVFNRHDVDLSGALATGAVVSAVLAISMQQTLGNILGGIALQLDGSIHEGNWIQLDHGKQGKVRAIRWRHTLVETRDWSRPSSCRTRSCSATSSRSSASATATLVAAAHVGVLQRRLPVRAAARVQRRRRGPARLADRERAPRSARRPRSASTSRKDSATATRATRVRYWLKDMREDDSTSSRVRVPHLRRAQARRHPARGPRA